MTPRYKAVPIAVANGRPQHPPHRCVRRLLGSDRLPRAAKGRHQLPDHPNGSILVFEKVLKDMKVELPKRP
jgi:hypothetical protein